jgi:hypothetical protein
MTSVQLHLPSSPASFSSCVEARLVWSIAPSPSSVWVTVERPMMRFLRPGLSSPTGRQGYVFDVVPDSVTPRPIPTPVVLTPISSLGSYIVPQTNTSLLCTLFPHSCAPEKNLFPHSCAPEKNFSVGHPSQIAPSQARLTWRFF